MEFVRKKCTHLNDEQLSWKPNSYTWSINEVFAHLNRYARYYHPTFERKIDSTKFRTPTDNFQSTPLGRASWKSMKLGNAKNIKRKFKAPIGYNPTVNTELVVGNDWEVFMQNQEQFLTILEAAKSINIRKAKIQISLSKIIKFRMGDALLFVAYHDERHVQQVKNLMAHKDFPKK